MVAAYKFRLVCHSSGSSLVSVRSALFAAMEAQQHLSIRLERMAQILEAAAPGDRALLSKSQAVSVVALIKSLDRKDRAKWAPMIPNWVDLVASMSGRVGVEREHRVFQQRAKDLYTLYRSCGWVIGIATFTFDCKLRLDLYNIHPSECSDGHFKLATHAIL